MQAGGAKDSVVCSRGVKGARRNAGRQRTKGQQQRQVEDDSAKAWKSGVREVAAVVAERRAAAQGNREYRVVVVVW